MPSGKGTYGSKRGRPPKRVARLKKDAKERRAGNPYGKPESAQAPHARARVGKKPATIKTKNPFGSLQKSLKDAVKRKREKAKKKKK